MNTFKCQSVVLIAVLLLPVAASADAAKEAYEKGQACLDKKDYDAAITAFTEAIWLDPEGADAYLKRAWAYLQKSQPYKAEADIGQAMMLRYVQRQTWLPEGVMDPVLWPTNALPLLPGSENPFRMPGSENPFQKLSLPDVPRVELPTVSGPSCLQPNEQSVPPPMERPQLIPAEPDMSK